MTLTKRIVNAINNHNKKLKPFSPFIYIDNVKGFLRFGSLESDGAVYHLSFELLSLWDNPKKHIKYIEENFYKLTNKLTK